MTDDMTSYPLRHVTLDPMALPCAACTAGPWEECDPMCLCPGCNPDDTLATLDAIRAERWSS